MTLTLDNTYNTILITFATGVLPGPTLVKVDAAATFHHTAGPTISPASNGVVGMVIDVDGTFVANGKAEYESTEFAPDLFTITLPWVGLLPGGANHTILVRARNFNSPLHTVVVDPLATVTATANDPTAGIASMTVLLFSRV